MRVWTSSGSGNVFATRLSLACVLGSLLAACASPAGPAGTSLSCASAEAEEALLDSEVPERLQAEWLIERADCTAYNHSVLR